MYKNIFEDSWKEFSNQIQNQRRMWSQLTNQYLENLNNTGREMMKNIHKQYDVAQEKTEHILEDANASVKKIQKEAASEIDSNELAGDWRHLMDNIQSKWSKLTNDNLKHINGSREKLSEALQENYGIARKDAEKQMDEWEKASRQNRNEMKRSVS